MGLAFVCKAELCVLRNVVKERSSDMLVRPHVVKRSHFGAKTFVPNASVSLVRSQEIKSNGVVVVSNPSFAYWTDFFHIYLL